MIDDNMETYKNSKQKNSHWFLDLPYNVKPEQKEIEDVKSLRMFLENTGMNLLIKLIAPTLYNLPEKTAILFDIDELETANYSSFYFETPGLGETISMIQRSSVFNQMELDFLSLRSGLRLIWPKPTSNKEVEEIKKVEDKIHRSMYAVAQVLKNRRLYRRLFRWRQTKNSKTAIKTEDSTPYWLRGAHHNLTRLLSEKNKAKYGPTNLPCILQRTNGINAYIISSPNKNIISFDYAVGPFLKDINILLWSYFNTRDLASEKRIKRAFYELLPIVLFFKGLIYAWDVPPKYAVDKESFECANDDANKQIQYLIAHEIGHIELEHPGILTMLAPERIFKFCS